MKFFRSKNILKNLIIMVSIIAILAGMFPNCVQAKTDTDDGGGILKPIEQFVVYLGDKVMQWLQNTFTTTEEISGGNGTYNYQYSPAIIFSGKVPAFDINFITPNTDVRNTNNVDAFIREKKSEFFNHVVKQDSWDKSIYEENINLAKSKDNAKTISEETRRMGATRRPKITKKDIIYYVENNVLVVECFKKISENSMHDYFYNKYTYELTDETLSEMNDITTYESTAALLQPTIATWYKALRRIALVGLLSVLVYVGIRIVLTSSAGEKAKYKGMLIDWLTAICILFTLHYIMSITITVTNKISSVFMTGESDELLNILRADIYKGNTWGEVLAKVIMYTVLVINTVTFTIQYLKRVIYMAFYTMVAPLIALTYPLDKIKDGQAQAFNMWIKEYIFTALIQVIHLIIYTVLISSALDLLTDYTLYAIIVLLFMSKADGIIKKMFGFDKSETVGTIGAAAAGGLVMNAISKLSNVAPKGGKAAEGSAGGATNNIRTASSNALASLREGGNGAGPGESGSSSSANGSVLGGVNALRGKYAKKAGGVVLRGGLGATGAMLGLAAGISQGDLKAAGAGLIAGGKAGGALGKRVSQSVNNGAIKNTINNIKDTWNEGAFGADFAQSASAAREFKSTSEYSKLKDKYGDSLTDESLRAMLDADIKDAKTMEKVLDSGDIGKAIGYYTLAQNCPDGIFYDNNMLKRYVEDIIEKEGLNKNDAATIIKNMKMYK